MNKIILLVLLNLLLFSCKNNETKVNEIENQKVKIKDTLIVTKQNDIHSLKKCEINEAYFNKRTKIAKPLNESEIKSMNLTMIGEINNNMSAKVKIIDTILSSQNNKIIIVSQESENESSAFFVQLNDKNKAFAFEPVYYADFVEYFYTTSTKITDKKIEIITETDNGEGKPTKEVVKLNFINGKLIK